LAWCQTGLDVVLPYGKISEKNENDKLRKLAELITEEKIDKLVVGLPLGLKSEENNNTKKIRNFADQLKLLKKIEIEFVDERFSSHQADRMGGGGASRDELAAMVILQSFLDKK
jgi:putative Holliday junction resolvase